MASQQPDAELEPALLDGWLREHMNRSLVVIGVTLGSVASDEGPTISILGESPTDFVRGMEPYGEIWLRWLAAGMVMDRAVAHAAAQEADALIIWVPKSPDDETPAARDALAGANGEWPERALRALLEVADAHNLRDRCVLVLAGPGASRQLARRLGYDDGFGEGAAPGQVAVAIGREAVSREEYRTRGSSPPCYL